jgi:hypothetical protein
MAYKMNFHKVSKSQVRKGNLIQASFQAKIYVARNQNTGRNKDKAYKEIFAQMKQKYPELSDEETKDIILRYL